MKKVPKLHIEGALFYATCRGDNNEDIFKDDADYATYLEFLKKYKSQYQFKLFAFSLLPNHLHLLLELKEGDTISDVMHDLNSNYTKYFNAKYQRKGHLFQERNRMAIVEKIPYIAKVSAYIHLNVAMVRPGFVPAEYVYSSLPLYISPVPDGKSASLVGAEQIQEVLGYCGFPSYKDFIAAIGPEEMLELSRLLRKKVILGSDEFVAKVNRKAEEFKAQLPLRQNGAGQRNFAIAGSVALIIVGALTIVLYHKSIVLNEKLKKESSLQQDALNRRMVQEKIKISRDLDEKYRADLVSYAAMAKRLEIEKNKVKQLEAKR